jgi:hypothetical protein
MDSVVGRAAIVSLYVPAVVLGLARIVAVAQSTSNARLFVSITSALDRLELLYLAICLIGGFLTLIRALPELRTITARRQLRWIRMGNGARRGRLRIGVRAAVCPWRRTVAADGAVGAFP